MPCTPAAQLQPLEHALSCCDYYVEEVKKKIVGYLLEIWQLLRLKCLRNRNQWKVIQRRVLGEKFRAQTPWVQIPPIAPRCAPWESHLPSVCLSVPICT